jgi:hypothetical protein
MDLGNLLCHTGLKSIDINVIVNIEKIRKIEENRLCPKRTMGDNIKIINYAYIIVGGNAIGKTLILYEKEKGYQY